MFAPIESRALMMMLLRSDRVVFLYDLNASSDACAIARASSREVPWRSKMTSFVEGDRVRIWLAILDGLVV